MQPVIAVVQGSERKVLRMFIYGEMNYYGNLLKVDGAHVYYAYGCRLDNITGVLIINTEEETRTNKQLPDGIEVENERFRSFANKVLGKCMSGEIPEKVSREIG